jgi:hypothetical protein
MDCERMIRNEDFPSTTDDLWLRKRRELGGFLPIPSLATSNCQTLKSPATTRRRMPRYTTSPLHTERGLRV